MEKIVTTPSPSLREPSDPILEITDEVRQVVTDMIDSCLAWEKEHPHEISAAMAAPQLGKNLRVIVVRDDLDHKENNSFTAFLNPKVTKTEGKVTRDYEGCLSVPFLYGLVPRPEKARVKAKLLNGNEVRLKASGFLARTLLHEIDHLDGILFIDHIKNKKDAFFEIDDNGDLRPVDYESRIKNNKSLWGEEDND